LRLLSATDRSLATFAARPNGLALDQAKKLSYIRSNSDSGGTGADGEVALSLADVVMVEEEEGEE